jgi:hypothetical protein
VRSGDLVKQVTWPGIGIVICLDESGEAAVVVFADGEYYIDNVDLEVVSESR